MFIVLSFARAFAQVLSHSLTFRFAETARIATHKITQSFNALNTSAFCGCKVKLSLVEDYVATVKTKALANLY